MAEKRLILTGFMGMGKSTIGPRVAESLGVEYQDTDRWLEDEAGIDIPHLVRTDQDEFRRLEADVLEVILGQEPSVISTGGGIVSTEVGRLALINSRVPVLWLHAPFEVALARVRADTAGRPRPLFSDEDKARALYEERLDWYDQTATCSVDASGSVDEVVETIVNMHSRI